MVESISRTLLPVFLTVGLLLSLLMVVYGISWVIEFHL